MASTTNNSHSSTSGTTSRNNGHNSSSSSSSSSNNKINKKNKNKKTTKKNNHNNNHNNNHENNHNNNNSNNNSNNNTQHLCSKYYRARISCEVLRRDIQRNPTAAPPASISRNSFSAASPFAHASGVQSTCHGSVPALSCFSLCMWGIC